ncbi:MAG: glycine cleavage system aminomethyltransferase GcvT, partial [Bacteroidia bacterium]|nr:glycine cleavage system aminomethyltransferase GcvT [Bacteroidia bacterium]MDW8159759.1 glycine cleavage system aminomethyltransferase GcvT [Bacteroidia bacterium]
GAKILPFAGYLMPIRYVGDTIEHMAVREKAGIFDVSHMGEFLVRGPHALDLIQYVTSNDASTLPIGKAQYSCLPNDRGGIVDDLIVYRLEEELYLLVVNASNIEKDWNWLNQHNRFGAQLEDISQKTALLAVSGPKAEEILQKLTTAPLDQMEYYALTRCTFAGYDNILIATTGYTGEKTFEIFLRNEQALEAWNAILEAGKELGLIPAGLGARDTLRLEMGYMLYGNDLNETTSPLEAGLGWITKLNKGNFIGSEILKEQKSKGLQKKLIAFEMLDKGIPRSHYLIAKEGRIIGQVTSGTFSPCLKNGIGMGYVEAAFGQLGETIEIIIRDKPVLAKVRKAPFVSETSLTGWAKKKN